MKHSIFLSIFPFADSFADPFASPDFFLLDSGPEVNLWYHAGKISVFIFLFLSFCWSFYSIKAKE